MKSVKLSSGEDTLARLDRIKEPKLKVPGLLAHLAMVLSTKSYDGAELVDAVRDAIAKWPGPPAVKQLAIKRCMDFVHTLVDEFVILEDAITRNAHLFLDDQA